MENDKRINWESDFRNFLEVKGDTVPAEVSENVLGSIRKELNPSFLQVLVKLAFIQAAAGAVSLLFCPQFGFAFTSSHGLMPYLMQFGENVCMVGCGAFFTGISLIIASLVLRTEEVRALREHRLLQVTAIAALSLGVFFCMGAKVLDGLTLIWALGAIVGGITTLELGWGIRRLSYTRGAL